MERPAPRRSPGYRDDFSNAMALTTPALLLRSAPFQEADRMLTLFAPKQGKVSACAKGARKSWRRFGGAIEPFALFEATFTRTNAPIWLLSEARLIDAHDGLARDLARIGAASLIIELVREIVQEGEAQEELFNTTVQLLGLLASADARNLTLTALAGELKILSLAGTAVSADRCSACGRLVPSNRRAYFHPARGGVICTKCGGGPIALSKEAAALLIELDKHSPAELTQIKSTSETQQEIWSAVHLFIEHHLGRSLRSASVIHGSSAGLS